MGGHQNIIGMNQTGLTAYNSTNGVVYANTITASNGVAVTNGGGGSSSPDIQGTSATASAVGVAKFPTADFVVTSGSVALEAGRRQTSLSYSNLSLTLSAGVITLAGFDATALSATNPAYIYMPSNATISQTVQYTLTANQTLTISNMTNNLLGQTTGIAVTSSFPVWVYLCTAADGTTLTLGVSGVPHLRQAPAVGTIGTPASAVATTQGSLFLASSVTVANYAANAVLCIGSFLLQMNSSNVYTAQALTNSDGIGQFNDNTLFTFPIGLKGASANGHFASNGGTAPVFSTDQIFYTVARNGTCTTYIDMDGDGGTDGAGAVQALLIVPYVGNSSLAHPQTYAISQGFAGGSAVLYRINPNGGSNQCYLIDTAAGVVQLSVYTNASRGVYAELNYLMSIA
jgi:hypothetical protein